jgi:hypothetical protein
MFTSNQSWPKFPFNPNDFRDLRSRLHSFESMAAYTRRDMQFSGTGEATRLSGFAVPAGFFHVLGLKPAIGREFDRQDEFPGKGHVAIKRTQTVYNHHHAGALHCDQLVDSKNRDFRHNTFRPR